MAKYCAETNAKGEGIWGHVQGTMVASRAILILSACATPATLAVPAIVAAMGVATAPSVASVATFARVTLVHIDALRVVYNQYAVNEAKAKTMIIMTLEKGDVMSLLRARV